MERLQKILAQAGVASRRKCEEYIAAGRVQVNDKTVTELGFKADPATDKIVVDGKPINRESKVYLLLNKPKGVITSVNDPEGRKVVTDYLPGVKERVYPVGRLDYDTEGLLLLTNDGEFANLLTHPRHEVWKTYHATVRGVPNDNQLDKLRRGIRLEDGMTLPAEVEYYDADPDKKEAVISVSIREGRNRQVRRMLEAIGHPVVRLKRVQYGPVGLMGVPRGKYIRLRQDQVEELRKAALQSHNVQNQPQ